ncbi:hypothetical protein BHE90_002118 [Fusarium euwallaceae]|uniref:Uncharacterized protein n=1 Tax=Fusarium euwallaceae TaxID=1147111 RepID=A0A430M5U8_9HYPO|nr:hypothetical protein BHE90_002118 [Fusarium euwallaceae]
MAPNPPSTNTDCVQGEDTMSVENNSMLLPYLYDNTSFSNLLVELTLVNSTTGEGHTNASDCVNVNATQEKKDDKSSGN